jgi:nucleotide-binding universal stress UspA family protein
MFYANQEFPMSNAHTAIFSATKILLPIDFSPSSEAVLEAATGLALQFHAAVHLIHIIPAIPDLNGADFFPGTAVLQERSRTIEEMLDARKERLMHSGVPTTFSIEEGNDIAGSLLRVIRNEKADMVVISTHGMSGWHPLIFGSIAEEVIKQAKCTLLLLQPGKHEPAAEEPGTSTWGNAVSPQLREMVEAGPPVALPESLAPKQLDRDANDMAEQGAKTEQHYDEAHSIFTK